MTVAQESQDNEDYNDTVIMPKIWIPCESTTTPRLSCYNCNTRMICKNYKGALLKPCNYSLKPYCNEGICSATPTAGCEVF